MSVMDASAAGAATDGAAFGAEPRVRELARDAVTRMVFSAAVSSGVVLLMLIAHGLGR
ncbi:hypothetical protein [Nocardioides humilatus]|uniref:hypothetical protein n=1 Tax=Nocardioides humilatus TaxID=2607660 RepID=UPI00165EE6DC|nr:hypothetical protein [Nocardioides humilatus]